jgi:DNA polymerase III delta prime subunit
MSLVIHPATQSQYERIISNLPHALLINGADGVGKTTIAQRLMAEALNMPVDKLSSYPYYLQITALANSISIDTVREIKHFFDLKTIGSQTIRRGILIEHAESLTIEAQNALLKTIEEPPSDSLIILTVGHEQLLLPTIVSRLQRFTVHRPKDQETYNHFLALINDPKIVSAALALGNGLPGLTHAILFSEEHPLLLGIEKAKAFLKSSKFARLNLIDEYVQPKEGLLTIMQALLRIAESSLQTAAHNKDDKNIRQWEKIMAAAYRAENSLLLNAQPKLVLNNLILEL